MAFRTTLLYFIICVKVLFFSAFCVARSSYISTRATYYQTPDGLGTPNGACGLGEYGRKINHARVSGVSRLYMDGSGCGTCFQVRCKDPQYCCEEGTKVVVTDYGEGDNTDFILSRRAFAELAGGKAAAENLFAAGVVEVEYRRVYCGLPGPEFVAWIDEKHSNFPNYIAVVVLFQGAHEYIEGVSIIAIEDKQFKIRSMRRAYGAVWDLANHPNILPFLLIKMSKETAFRWVHLQLHNGFPSSPKSENYSTHMLHSYF